jgi:hypothetical protein
MLDVFAVIMIQKAEGGPSGGWLIFLLWIVVNLAGTWMVFEKAGRPGWAAIVPIYNLVVLLRITSQSLWWILLVLIPGVNVVAFFIINLNLAWRFGKDLGYAFGLTILPFIFYPILGLGGARYRPGRGPVPLPH